MRAIHRWTRSDPARTACANADARRDWIAVSVTLNLSATYNEGPWSGTVQTRYLSSAHLVNGWTSGVQVDNNDVPQIAYLDLRASYKWNENLQFYMAVDNALDIPPPSTVSYSPSNNAFTTTNPSVYDVLGRMWHGGIRFTL